MKNRDRFFESHHLCNRSIGKCAIVSEKELESAWMEWITAANAEKMSDKKEERFKILDAALIKLPKDINRIIHEYEFENNGARVKALQYHFENLEKRARKSIDSLSKKRSVR